MSTPNERGTRFFMIERGFALVFVLLIVVWLLPECGNPRPKQEERSSENLTEVKKGKAKTWLYISQDSLKFRAFPNLDSTVVARLPYGTMVEFLGERTKFRQKIMLQGQLYNEPWVRIRLAEGTNGWIYAGGARFYPLEANE
ncbi:MAG: SH3 domain-containing protein [Bacteroidota bacterium]